MPLLATVSGGDVATPAALRDLSSQIEWDGEHLHIPGSVIDSVGTAAKSRADDVSSPGLLLHIHIHTK
jgi:hypothetical protein